MMETVLMLALAAWTPALEQWRQEIEMYPVRVRVADVLYDAAKNEISLPQDTPDRAWFVPYLERDSFVNQFMASNAMTVTINEANGQRALIFMNRANAKNYSEPGEEEAILAHELGHVWLRALRYPAPALVDGATTCLPIHTGDVVQHVLIRREMARRGIRYMGQWSRSMSQALEWWEKVPREARLDACESVRLAALWVDMRLGLSAESWAGRERWDKLHTERWAEVAEASREIAAYVADKELEDKSVHAAALRYVFARLQKLAKHYEQAVRR